MRGRHVLAVAMLVPALATLTGCGAETETVRLGVLTDCQGPFRAFEEAQLSGAEVPFLRRGARLAGAGPSSGVTDIEEGGRRIELVRGCQEAGEHTVYVEEARRLVETEKVDVVIGGSSVVARDLARRYPEVAFVSAFWDDQEVTLRRPAPNLFRFTPDYAQQAAGLGAYAYRELGWRRAAVVGGDQPPGWDGAAAFTAEFCALGGRIVRESFRSFYDGRPDVVAQALAARPDGVAAFLTGLDDQSAVVRGLVAGLGDPRRVLVSAATMEDVDMLSRFGPRLAGMVGTTWLSSAEPSSVLRDYRRRYRAAFPGFPPFLADQSWVIGYHNAVEAVLQAVGRADDVRGALLSELADLRVPLPGGTVSLDGNRQAVRDGYLARIAVAGGKATLEPVGVVRGVEQTFGGLLSSAPPPGPGSQPCVRSTRIPWAR